MSAYLELLDWRRRVSELFVELRRRPPDAETLAWFRAEKDALYRAHPRTPIPADSRAGFDGLAYWPYDPAARVEAHFTPDTVEPAHPPLGDLARAEEPRTVRVGWLDFTLHGAARRLGAHWVAGYAGGLFVPFRDATSGSDTYGGGRYLVDSIKSADLGSDHASGTVTLDFNYAYHPSCAYDPAWVCPLAPPDNWLPVAVRAGERLRTASSSPLDRSGDTRPGVR